MSMNDEGDNKSPGELLLQTMTHQIMERVQEFNRQLAEINHGYRNEAGTGERIAELGGTGPDVVKPWNDLHQYLTDIRNLGQQGAPLSREDQGGPIDNVQILGVELTHYEDHEHVAPPAGASRHFNQYVTGVTVRALLKNQAAGQPEDYSSKSSSSGTG